MYSESAPLEEPIVSPAVIGRAIPRGRQRTVVEPVKVKEKKEHPGLEWSACILRIRETRDRAAFAALFRHFAPRVKAFLMRSGADAAMAEECTQEVMAAVWQKAHLFDPSLETREGITRLLDAAVAGNLNTVIVQAARRHDAFYASDVLPTTTDDELAGGLDVLAELVPAAHERGLQVHVWYSLVPSTHRTMLEEAVGERAGQIAACAVAGPGAARRGGHSPGGGAVGAGGGPGGVFGHGGALGGLLVWSGDVDGAGRGLDLEVAVPDLRRV